VADPDPIADRHPALEDDVMADLDAALERDLGSDHAERADADVGLEERDIETALRQEIAHSLPSDRAVPVSVNRGRPVVVDDPESRAARSLADLARSLLGAVGDPR
jgi:septum formation inhibitor-activating ATPase MinD